MAMALLAYHISIGKQGNMRNGALMRIINLEKIFKNSTDITLCYFWENVCTAFPGNSSQGVEINKSWIDLLIEVVFNLRYDKAHIWC